MSASAGFGRLVVTELGRLRSRRMTVVTALVLLAVVGLFQLLVHSQVSQPSAEERSQAQAQFEDSARVWQSDQAEYVAQCTASGSTEEQCKAEYPAPVLSDFLREPVPLEQVGVPTTAAYLSMLASFLVAASFIGAEYTTGSLANWLTFVPERLKVYGSKVVAVLLASALAGAVVAFTLAGLAAVQVAASGLPVTGAGHVAAASGRVAVLAAVAGLVGFALALLTRHTVAALGVPLAYAILGTVLVAFSYNGSGPLAWLPPYLPNINLSAFIDHGTTYTQYVNEMTPQGLSQTAVEKKVSFLHGSVYWLVVALLALVPSALVFRRRDVT